MSEPAVHQLSMFNRLQQVADVGAAAADSGVISLDEDRGSDVQIMGIAPSRERRRQAKAARQAAAEAAADPARAQSGHQTQQQAAASLRARRKPAEPDALQQAVIDLDQRGAPTLNGLSQATAQHLAEHQLVEQQVAEQQARFYHHSSVAFQG